MSNLHKLALVITLHCLFLSQIYLYLGGSSLGRDAFRHLMDYLLPMEDDNVKVGGLILIVFTVPLLVSGSVCILLLKCRSRGDDMAALHQFNTNGRILSASNEEHYVSIQEKKGLLPNSSLQKYKSRLYRYKPSNPRKFAFVFIILPCLVFYICNIHRHYQLYTTSYLTTTTNQTEMMYLERDHMVYDMQISCLYRQFLQHIANDSAIMALVAMTYLLVPVSKHSPLVLLAGWSPIEAVVIHQWAGRLGIAGILVHGGLHIICGYWRWWNALIQNNGSDVSFWQSYLPPWLCWKRALFGYFMDVEDLELGYGCIQETAPCQCYDYFLNLTGLIGMIALLALGCSSISYMRRHHYQMFYV